MEKISCCLITKLSEYPKIVLERLDTGFFDEIIIRTESPSVFERYRLASTARNNTIYVMDDDCLVNYQRLFKSYNGRITNTMPLNRQEEYAKLGCTMVGWGCYFPKEMMSVFAKYIQAYGENDPHLLREADRIFTYLNQPFNTITQPHEDLFQGKYESGEDRMTFEPNHWTSRNEALEKCKALLGPAI